MAEMPSSRLTALFWHIFHPSVHSHRVSWWRCVELLRLVKCRRAGCDLVTALCRRCFRGQGYCSSECRRKVRREQCQRAQRRYLEKRSGRRKQAAAAASYRRRKKGQPTPRSKIVIDQPLSSNEVSDYSRSCTARCSRCGRLGLISWSPS